MATKQNDKTPFDTLAHAKSVITTSLTEKVEAENFRNEADVEKYLCNQFKRQMDRGDYSYDPTTGEIILSFTPDLDVHRQLPDERRISTLVIEYFTNAGWDNVILIPARTGAHKALLRLRHPTLVSTELMQQGTRVERAIESALSR